MGISVDLFVSDDQIQKMFWLINKDVFFRFVECF